CSSPVLATLPNHNMLAGGQANQANPPIPGKKYTGLVTKLLDNFGFIDDSIFFPLRYV
ncbi:hypothetical protein TYRP_015229, partial [Tyrophagus putrescentiae]